MKDIWHELQYLFVQSFTFIRVLLLYTFLTLSIPLYNLVILNEFNRLILATVAHSKVDFDLFEEVPNDVTKGPYLWYRYQIIDHINSLGKDCY